VNGIRKRYYDASTFGRTACCDAAPTPRFSKPSFVLAEALPKRGVRGVGSGRP